LNLLFLFCNTVGSGVGGVRVGSGVGTGGEFVGGFVGGGGAVVGLYKRTK